MNNFDIVIVGGGHAGVEAAYISTQYTDLKVALVSLPHLPLASAPCNPSIGGVGKGQVVRELDALGGIMGKLADMAGIQYRTLNESKGEALQSTRVQIDKELYPEFALQILQKIKNLTLVQAKVQKISKIDDELFKIDVKNHLNYEESLFSKKLICTVGTFSQGILHCGATVSNGGRMNADFSPKLSELLPIVKFKNTRFKTGTPPRLQKNSIDFSKLEEQKSDDRTNNFHLLNHAHQRSLNQVSCYLTRTNSQTLKIIRDNKEKSPMYNGQISAIGARYCPSIEDKAYRYPEKNDHHVFLEPESLSGATIYPSGISTSLPSDIQDEFVKTIDGLEASIISKHGYAVEYDVVDTSQLKKTLEHKEVLGLFFAGQVNGTSGYEEAAAQGLIAGINAAQSLKCLPPLVLSRNDSFIGVMIEDLVSMDRDEPYRLFSARSENRLYIREDNAALRMYSYRKTLNLNHEIDQCLDEFYNNYQLLLGLVSESIFDQSGEGEKLLVKDAIKQDKSGSSVFLLEQYLLRNGLYFDYRIIKSVAIEVRYAGYQERLKKDYARVHRIEDKKLHFDKIMASDNVSFECKQRIKKFLPETFGQLKRLAGIRPASLAAIAGDIL